MSSISYFFGGLKKVLLHTYVVAVSWLLWQTVCWKLRSSNWVLQFLLIFKIVMLMLKIDARFLDLSFKEINKDIVI